MYGTIRCRPAVAATLSRTARSGAALAGTPRPPRAHSAHRQRSDVGAHRQSRIGPNNCQCALATPTHPPICNYSRNYSGIRSGSPTLTHHSINRHRTPLSRVGPSPGDHLVSALPSGCGIVICIISDVSTHASRTRMSHGINRWDSSLHKDRTAQSTSMHRVHRSSGTLRGSRDDAAGHSRARKVARGTEPNMQGQMQRQPQGSAL